MVRPTLAQAIAQKAMVPYIFEQANFIANEYVNSGPQYLQDLVAYVTDQQKVFVVILDEVHALLPDQKNATVQSKNADPLAAFFDLVNKTKKILVICTANTFDKLSQPTLDRFPKVIEIGELTQNQREEIIRFHLEQNDFDVSEDFIKKFAAGSGPLSSRRIKDCVDQAVVARRRLEKNGALSQKDQENLLNTMKKKLLHIKWLYTENPNARYWQIGTAIITIIPVLVVIVPPLFRLFQRYFPSETEKGTLALAQKTQADYKEIELGKLELGQRTIESTERVEVSRFASSERITGMNNASQERITQANNNSQWNSSLMQAAGTAAGATISAIGGVAQESIRGEAVKKAAEIAAGTASGITNTATTQAPQITNAVTQAVAPAADILQTAAPEIANSAIQTAGPTVANMAMQAVGSQASSIAAVAIQAAPVVANMAAPVVVSPTVGMAMQLVVPSIAQTAIQTTTHIANSAAQSTITPVARMAMQLVVPAATQAATVSAPAVAEAAVETGMSFAEAAAAGALGGAAVATAPAATAGMGAIMAVPAAPVLLPIVTTIVIGGAIGGGAYLVYQYLYKK